jgi:SHS2 domain-containing protein
MLRMVYGKEIQPDVQLNSEIVYESDESCVTRLLNDLIYRAEMTQLAIRVRKITLCNGVVRWEGFGEQVGKRNRGSIMVKAATYDRIKAIRDPAMIEVTLDI